MLERALRRFAVNETGATAIEYGLIAALIAVALITAMIALGGGVNGIFGIVVEKAGAVLAREF